MTEIESTEYEKLEDVDPVAKARMGAAFAAPLLAVGIITVSIALVSNLSGSIALIVLLVGFLSVGLGSFSLVNSTLLHRELLANQQK